MAYWKPPMRNTAMNTKWKILTFLSPRDVIKNGTNSVRWGLIPLTHPMTKTIKLTT